MVVVDPVPRERGDDGHGDAQRQQELHRHGGRVRHAEQGGNTADTPAPYSPVLLQEWLPNHEDVIRAVKKVLI